MDVEPPFVPMNGLPNSLDALLNGIVFNSTYPFKTSAFFNVASRAFFSEKRYPPDILLTLSDTRSPMSLTGLVTLSVKSSIHCVENVAIFIICLKYETTTSFWVIFGGALLLFVAIPKEMWETG